MRVRIDHRVFRAILRDRQISAFGGNTVMRGSFVVQVARWPYTKSRWAATINGDTGDVVCFGATATKTMLATRRYFALVDTNWQVGEVLPEGWRPVDVSREKELMGVA